ncbi:MAG: gamma carbonic anhydrase family protein, partial [bacterium]
HSAVVHGAIVEDGCLVGIGAIILSHSHVGAESVIGAGAVITEGTKIPPHSLVLGIPGKVVRSLDTEETPGRNTAESYAVLAAQYLSESGCV